MEIKDFFGVGPQDFLRSLHNTVRHLHFLSKNSTLISQRKLSIFFVWKTRENVVVLDFLAVDKFDFTRKIVKNILVEKLVKMLGICTF